MHRLWLWFVRTTYKPFYVWIGSCLCKDNNVIALDLVTMKIKLSKSRTTKKDDTRKSVCRWTTEIVFRSSSAFSVRASIKPEKPCHWWQTNNTRTFWSRDVTLHDPSLRDPAWLRWLWPMWWSTINTVVLYRPPTWPTPEPWTTSSAWRWPSHSSHCAVSLMSVWSVTLPRVQAHLAKPLTLTHFCSLQRLCLLS